MSFICDCCHKVQPKGKPVTLITAVREIAGGGRVRELNQQSADWIRPIQIAEEKKVCPTCAVLYGNRPPKVVGVFEEKIAPPNPPKRRRETRTRGERTS